MKEAACSYNRKGDLKKINVYKIKNIFILHSWLGVLLSCVASLRETVVISLVLVKGYTCACTIRCNPTVLIIMTESTVQSSCMHLHTVSISFRVRLAYKKQKRNLVMKTAVYMMYHISQNINLTCSVACTRNVTYI